MIGRSEKYCSVRICGFAIGRQIIEDTGRTLALLFVTLQQMISLPPEARGGFMHMEEIEIRSLPVVIVNAIFTGMAFALQAYTEFKSRGADYFFIDDEGKITADLLVFCKDEEHADDPCVRGGVNYFCLRSHFWA